MFASYTLKSSHGQDSFLFSQATLQGCYYKTGHTGQELGPVLLTTHHTGCLSNLSFSLTKPVLLIDGMFRALVIDTAINNQKSRTERFYNKIYTVFCV